MSLIPIDAEYHYVQDTAPSSANKGDVWLDTSVNPPVAKIYADIGNGLEWLQDQTASRVDIPVSDAGASATDITNAVWSDDQQHGPSDLKAAAVDWAAKTPKINNTGSHFGTTLVDISGSGFLITAGSSGTQDLAVQFDGGTTYKILNGGDAFPTIFGRFETSLKVTCEGSANAAWVLD